VLPVCTDAEVGLMLTATTAAAASVTVAVAIFEVSAALVAVTSKVPAVPPPVYKPAEETVPPVEVQVTPVFDVPVIVAENCCLLPGCSEAEVGSIAIATTPAPGFVGEPVVPPQLTRPSDKTRKGTRAKIRDQFSLLGRAAVAEFGTSERQEVVIRSSAPYLQARFVNRHRLLVERPDLGHCVPRPWSEELKKNRSRRPSRLRRLVWIKLFLCDMPVMLFSFAEEYRAIWIAANS
jgi:hypothetical protein